METQQTKELCASYYSKCKSRKNAEFLSKVMASWTLGLGVLPEYAGMSEILFRKMINDYFIGIEFAENAVSGFTRDPSREEERQNLIELLMQHRARDSDSEIIVAEIIASACLGNDHLWQDTGLWSRKDLSQVMSDNFLTLFQKNNKDMKWKKFLYKQLCDTEGIYVCRSPSCEVCDDYAKCFGPE